MKTFIRNILTLIVGFGGAIGITLLLEIFIPILFDNTSISILLGFVLGVACMTISIAIFKPFKL